MNNKRPYAKKVTYTITVLDSQGNRLDYLPSWDQDVHPFVVNENKQIRGEVVNARVMLQKSAHWTQRGGVRERRRALESLAEIANQGRRLPHMRLPDSAAAVLVKANGIPPSGMVWGKWEIEPLPYDAATIAIPEGWEPSPELTEWALKTHSEEELREALEAIRGYEMQTWRIDYAWPHADWYYEWFVEEGIARPECLYCHWQEDPPFGADTLAMGLFNLGLAGRWLSAQTGAERLPDGLIVHAAGMEIEYCNAHLDKQHRVGGR